MALLSSTSATSTPAAQGRKFPLTRTPVKRASPLSATSLPLSSNQRSGVLPKGDGLSSTRLPLFTRISAVVEHQAAVAKFEQLAGRSAMLGVATAVLVEVLSDTPIVGLSFEEGPEFLAAMLLVVSTSAIVAGMRRRKLGGLLLEAVVTSLTSTSGSASSLTGITPFGLDESVTQVLDRTFDKALMTDLLESNIESIDGAEAN